MREGPVRKRSSAPWRIAAAVALTGMWLLPAAPASASSLEGCSGTAQSLDSSGKPIDAASAAGGKIQDTQGGGDGFTASNPFVVDNDGVVRYSGSSDAVITNHHWKVKMLGVEVASGGSANGSGTKEDAGDFDLDKELPFKITGLVRVEGTLDGTGGSCSGDGFVKVQGSPLASPLTWAGAVFGAFGAMGVAMSLPKVKPTVGGVA
jgi:hypothetical protein